VLVRRRREARSVLVGGGEKRGARLRDHPREATQAGSGVDHAGSATQASGV